ncbi:MAG: hypothetical protein R3358_11985, partial [Woeseiaceae bacterium]|nr:hypothetical protein [Woeseiaceae bacterium]
MLKAGAALAVIALLALAWFLWTGVAVDVPATAPAPPADSPSPERAETVTPRTRPAPVNAGPGDSDAAPDPQAASQPERCWEIEDIGEQGLPEHELELIYSVAPMGPHFETYRHLDLASVEAIAAQGDSAAMTLAGLMILGQAFGADT